MPGLWSDKYDCRAPVRSDASQGDPKQPVACLQARATVRPLQRHQLLPERQVLQDELSMPTKSQRQRTSDEDQQLDHGAILTGASARSNSKEFWRGSPRLEARILSWMRTPPTDGTLIFSEYYVRVQP
jgi:hypothetical protein